MKFVFAKLFITIFLPGIDGGPTLLHWINLPKIFEIYERKENFEGRSACSTRREPMKYFLLVNGCQITKIKKRQCFTGLEGKSTIGFFIFYF